MLGTRPSLAYAVSFLGRFMHAPTKEHMKMAHRTLSHLVQTKDHGITFDGNNKDSLKLIGYSDSDYASDITDRKSVSGYIFILANAPISWKSRKQSTVANSSTEAEYIALANATKEAVWLRRFLLEVNLPQPEPTVIRGDNNGSLFLAKNPVNHDRTKHIDVKHHFVREKLHHKTITLEHVPTQEQLADALTKALPKPLHNRFIEALNLASLDKYQRNKNRGDHTQ